jgi:hypothetical protein
MTPDTPPNAEFLRIHLMNLRSDILSLSERLRGLGMTPKHLREERRQTLKLKLELEGKIQEHDQLVDEYNALLTSKPAA